MSRPSSISLVLPAFDEVDRITDTVRDAQAYLRGSGLRHQIVVAVDGTDGTREAVELLAGQDTSIVLTGGTARRGKGRSVREALALCTGDVVGFMDADGKTPAAEIDKAVRCFVAGADVVVGSRKSPGARIEHRGPLHRRVGSTVFAAAARRLLGLGHLADPQCGFKFFTRDAARRLFSLQRIDGYMFDVEVLVLADALGLRVDQVPVEWSDDGDSRSDLLLGTVRHVIDLARVRAARRPRGASDPGR